ncbi:MAG TPA: hypothetical protein VJV03_18605 [Pyrinomonadaceae bacterium]|nr:hypothetical protein [Pyrinomonadaceae bacterium]
MKEEPVTKEVARRFLLGAVDDSERQRIESLFITSPDVQATLLSAEEELFDDYFEGGLSVSDSAKFVERFGRGERQQRKLNIAGSIRNYALSEGQRNRASSSIVEKFRHLISLPAVGGRRLYIPAAVTLVLLVIAAIWLAQWNNQRQSDADLRLALERELNHLNSPSNLTQEQTYVSVVLPPLTLRSSNQSSQTVSQTAHQIVELQLLLTRKQELQNYRAVLRRVGSADEFILPGLRPAKSSAGSVVKLRVPARSLPRGHYLISLTGSPDAPGEEYDFVIGG